MDLNIGHLFQLSIIILGRPIQFGNLKFTWRSPDKDMGPVRFLGSVVFNGQYLLLDAKINGSRIKNRGEIPYKEFPVNSLFIGNFAYYKLI